MKILESVRRMLGEHQAQVSARIGRIIENAERCPTCGHGGELAPELAEERARACDCDDLHCVCTHSEEIYGG